MNRPSRSGPRRAEVIRVDVKRMAWGGEAYGVQVDGPSPGRSVFVWGAAPGETVDVEVTESRKSYARGRIAGEPGSVSPSRVERFCPVSTECGGCAWQHLSEEAQRQQRREMLDFELGRLARRTGTETQPLGEHRWADDSRQRERLRLQFGVFQGRAEVGFTAWKGRDIVAVDACPVAASALREAPAHVRRALEGSIRSGRGTALVQVDHRGQRFVSIRGRIDEGGAAGLADALAEVGGFTGVLVATEFDEERRGDQQLAIALGGDEGPVEHAIDGFSQANRAVWSLLRRDVVTRLADGPAPRRALDLFSGSGALTAPLAELAESIVAVDVDASAVSALDSLSEARDLSIEAVAADLNEVDEVMRILEGPDEDARGPSWDLAVLDPPREGAKVVCQSLRPEVVRRVVYVSCSPPTQFRDLQALLRNGYRLEAFDAYEMFPHTGHVETVAWLVPADTDGGVVG